MMTKYSLISILQLRLSQNTGEGALRKLMPEVACHCHAALLGRVLELTVAASLRDLIPAIFL